MTDVLHTKSFLLKISILVSLKQGISRSLPQSARATSIRFFKFSGKLLQQAFPSGFCWDVVFNEWVCLANLEKISKKSLNWRKATSSKIILWSVFLHSMSKLLRPILSKNFKKFWLHLHELEGKNCQNITPKISVFLDFDKKLLPHAWQCFNDCVFYAGYERKLGSLFSRFHISWSRFPEIRW